jgi:hypothetical protein
MRVEVTIERMGGQVSTARCLVSTESGPPQEGGIRRAKPVTRANAQMSEWESGRRIAAGMHTTMRPKGGRKMAAKL